jgi:hypothetical protein
MLAVSTQVVFKEPVRELVVKPQEASVSSVKPQVPALPDSIPPFPGHIVMEKVLVTPQLAQHYLDTMHDNRGKSKLEISVLSDMLKEGAWFPDISPVFLDGQDRAWDGQHRFEAVVKTGLSAWMLFIRGVTPEASEYIDTNRKRTYADSLKIRQIPDYKRRSVVSRTLALYQKYGIEGVRQPAGLGLTPMEQDAWVDAPGISAAIKAGEALGRAVRANPSYAAYAVFQTARRDENGDVTVEGIDADGFWESVRTGAELKEGNPALTLHNYLMAGRVKKSATGNVDPRLMELYVLATAWNKHVTGERWTRPNPLFEKKANGDKYFPASHVPDFLSLDLRKKHIGQLTAAFAARKAVQ